MKARSRILLATEPHIYIHVEDAATAKDAWNNLARTFEDAGQNNRIALMRALTDTRLDKCQSMEEYVYHQIISYSNRLNAIKFKVDDEWIGTFLLAGLTPEYDPLIMSITSTRTLIISLSRTPSRTYAHQVMGPARFHCATLLEPVHGLSELANLILFPWLFEASGLLDV
jgi:hypothetical protein